MKNNIKKVFGLLLVIVLTIVITGCGNTESAGEKTSGGSNKSGGKTSYTFPTASFIPSGVEYKGTGKLLFSTKNENSNPKYADAYISGATIEDVVAYVQTLKSKGLHNANAYKEEQTDFDEWGSFSWVGTNDAEDFSISVTLTTDTTELSLVDGSYNLSIAMSDDNPYGE